MSGVYTLVDRFLSSARRADEDLPSSRLTSRNLLEVGSMKFNPNYCEVAWYVLPLST